MFGALAERERKFAKARRVRSAAQTVSNATLDSTTTSAVGVVVGRGSSTAIATGTTIVRRIGFNKSEQIIPQTNPRNIAAITSLK